MGMVEQTIAAVATSPGRGGIGIIRVSGPQAKTICRHILGLVPTPRAAHFSPFKNKNGDLLDEGIALFFPGPNSFTGEDILELQGHGGPVVLHQILQAVCDAGARQARPGEFSERAFLNNKIDLVQAEAIADLIDASSNQAARSALRTLQGEFSKKINSLLESLIRIRVFIESALDFSEEEIDFLADSAVLTDLNVLEEELQDVLHSANQGALLREGMSLVLLGKPNVGKSSLLNCLAAKETAIVTPIAGTTRDVLRESIQVNGMPIHLIDTAGLHTSEDIIEQEGMRRAWQEAQQADLIVIVVDSNDFTQDAVQQQIDEVKDQVSEQIPLWIVCNKVDLQEEALSLETLHVDAVLAVSAKTGAGIDVLTSSLMEIAGLQSADAGQFSARGRHVAALTQAMCLIQQGKQHFSAHTAAELLAEDLRLAQQCLGEVTGKFTSDDLLGNIFSTFCVGK